MTTAQPFLSLNHSTPVAAAVGLSKSFGATRALRDVSLTVMPGEIRALAGRNGAGKSTLVSILTGVLKPDKGTIQFSGVRAPAPHERDRWQRNVACVYQHSKIIPTLNCAENLFLTLNMSQRRLVSWQRMRREARGLFTEWGLPLDPDTSASSLTVGRRQLLEIARALIQGTRFLILDEPTAKLDGREAQHLFGRLLALRSQGVGILYISHHLEEIFEIAQCVTVLRDGQRTMDRSIPGLSIADLVEAMVGSAADPLTSPELPKPPPLSRAPNRLEVRELSLPGHFHNVSFSVRAGECLGLAGLAGSGKEAIGEVLAGFSTAQSGTVFLDGNELEDGDVSGRLRAGIGFVPQDRHAQGLVLGLSVAENATLSVTDRLGHAGFIQPRTQRRQASEAIRGLGIKADDLKSPVTNLSGGNQQKVVLARALARDPRVLVLINPTAGVDIASKAVLFASIRAAARRGAAILIISDELEELELCQRVLVIRTQCLTAEFTAPWTPKELVAEMEGVRA